MRQTRIKRIRSNKRDKLIRLIVLFVIAPIIAVMISFGLFKYLVLPKIIQYNEPNINVNIVSKGNNESVIDNDDDNIENNFNFKIKSISLYSVQIGSFKDLQNAKDILEEVTSKGIAGYILKLDDYKVFAGTFVKRTDSEKYIDYVKESYKDAFISEKLVNCRKIKYTKEELDYVDSLENTLEILRTSYSEETSLWLEVLNGSELSLIKNMIMQNNKTLADKMKLLNEKLISNETKELVKSINSNLQKRTKLVNDLSESETIESYTRYIEVLIQYINIIKMN